MIFLQDSILIRCPANLKWTLQPLAPQPTLFTGDITTTLEIQKSQIKLYFKIAMSIDNNTS